MTDSEIIDFALDFIDCPICCKKNYLNLQKKYHNKMRLWRLIKIIPCLGETILIEKAYMLQAKLLMYLSNHPKANLVYNWFYSGFMENEHTKLKDFEDKFNRHFDGEGFTMEELQRIKDKTPLYHQLKKGDD